MKAIKKILFLIIAVIVFNICFDFIESVADWLYLDIGFIIYWLFIPLAATLSMTIIKLWLFRDQSVWMLVIAFLINFFVMVPYGYYLQMLREESGGYLNIVFYLILLAAVSAVVQSFLIVLVNRVTIKIANQKHEDTDSVEMRKNLKFKQKKWPVFFGIAIIIFHLCFFLVIFLADICLISGVDAYWIFFPVIPIIIMVAIKEKYFQKKTPWLVFLGFLFNFLFWISGALLRFLLEGKFISGLYGRVALISTLSALSISCLYSLIYWFVWRRKHETEN